MEGRSFYARKEGEAMAITRDGGSHTVSCAMPIISEGDVVGCVVSARSEDAKDQKADAPAFDVEAKLIQTAAGFLGKQLES